MIYSGEMVWFIGVVEDRKDPLEIGRVRVRCFGIHTDDKSILPTEDLPWASMILPSNSAGFGSIGQSATGIVQGAWVVGFFTDGKSMQQPLVMGVLPSQTYENSDKGFTDPDNVHPYSTIYDNDQPFSATYNFREHPSYFTRADIRIEDIETAVPPKVTTVAEDKDDSYYNRPTWSTPEVMEGGSTSYPFNKVLASESGHTIEVDDTPTNERLAQFHTSGTNYEINASGNKTETIVGDNYQLILKGNNLYVKGNMNITVDQDVRMLVKGNYHLEVEGDYTQNIKGSKQTKIKNSEFKETGNDFVSNVTDDYTQRIGGMELRIVDSDMRTTITGNEERTIKKDYGRVVIGNTDLITIGNENKAVTGTLDIKSTKDFTMETESNMITDVDLNKTVNVNEGNVNIDVKKGTKTEHVKGNVSESFESNQTTAITGNLDVDAARIDLN